MGIENFYALGEFCHKCEQAKSSTEFPFKEIGSDKPCCTQCLNLAQRQLPDSHPVKSGDMLLVDNKPVRSPITGTVFDITFHFMSLNIRSYGN